MRGLVVLFCLCPGLALGAVTDRMPDLPAPSLIEPLDAFAMVHAAWEVGYNGFSPPVPPTRMTMALQAQVIIAASLALVCFLPRNRRRRHQASRAAVEISRIRCTMARNPFDRWADRWSFRPSRASSPGASISSTSETARSE